MGAVTLATTTATKLARSYLTGDDGRTYAYPCYDRLKTNADPAHLSDGDLLAPGLLNAAPTIVGYRSLKQLRPRLEKVLREIPPRLDILRATGHHFDLLADLYEVLSERRPGVRATTLSKVLHRKRPHFIPLHDRNVTYVYQLADGAPVPRDRHRSWPALMTTLALQMRDDLDRDVATWDTLRHLGRHGPVSRLRALDIVVFQVGSPHTRHRTSKRGTTGPQIPA